MRKRTITAAMLAVAVGSASASVISVNFTESASASHANQQMAAGTTAGLTGYVYANWNNTAGSSGTLGSLTDSDGITTAASVVWTSSNVWGDGLANPDANAGIGDAQMARGYCDDGAPGMDWTVTGIPFAEYTVVLYLSTDGDGGIYLPFSVNGTSGSTTGDKHQYTNPNWDASNTIVFEGLSGDLTVDGPARDGASRGSVAGFQIAQIPEPATFGMVAIFGGGIIFLRRHKLMV